MAKKGKKRSADDTTSADADTDSDKEDIRNTHERSTPAGCVRL